MSVSYKCDFNTMKIPIAIVFSALALSAANDATREKEVLAAMDAWKQATIAKDRAALEKLLHPDLTYTHSSGMTQTKDDVVKSVTTGNSAVEAIDFTGT